MGNDTQDAEVQQAEVGSGINGEVWPCPNCHKHESVMWIHGNAYKYECLDCVTVFTVDESKEGFDD